MAGWIRSWGYNVRSASGSAEVGYREQTATRRLTGELRYCEAHAISAACAERYLSGAAPMHVG